MTRLQSVISAILFLVLFNFSGIASSFAQNANKVSGSVIDSSQTAIVDAYITIIAGKDTLRTVSNKQGNFTIQNIKATHFSLQINMLGYKSYSAALTFGEKQKSLQLDPIILTHTSNMLKEVVIKGKVNPVRVMQDTIEFNAAAYQVLEGDRVSDLLRQLPGLEIDDEDNVSTMGKGMTKLRVNGKDFFTNNVKDFINKLPASIVAKIQIVDDYGDQANFTGIKVGEPIKMLNIVTKPGMNKGVFGAVGLSGGTNDQVGVNGNANIWREKLQVGSNLNVSQANNGAGQTRGKNANANYRKSFKGGSIGISYNFNSNFNDNENMSLIETINTIGTIFNENASKGNGTSDYHNLGFDFQRAKKENFFTASGALGISSNKSINGSASKQSGVIKQDLFNESSSSSQSPNLNANLWWSKRMNKKGKSISANVSVRNGESVSEQNILSRILYYQPITNVLAKDSLLNRLIDSKSNNFNVNGSITYSQPLKKLKDTLARQSVNVSYNFSLGNTNNDILTYVTDKANNLRYVDSLSTKYESLFFSQNIGLSYSFTNKKINYSVGGSVRPNLLIGDYQNLNVKIKNNTLNFAPSLNLSYRPTKSSSLSARYNGNSASPSPNQLQPVRNTQNLQNVVIGNPNLKPSFTHSVNLSFNSNNVKTGRLFQLDFGSTVTQNKIVSNVVLLRDTLNSLKQQTSYENANGSYGLSGNYSYTLPLKKNKINLSIRGNFTSSHNIVYTDNVKFFNDGLYLSQSGSSNFIFKKASISASISYGSNMNNYTLNKSNATTIETWTYGLNARATLFKTYRLTMNMAKRINSGYSIQNTNPLILGASFNKTFLKSKALSLTVQAFDLLKQGNNLSRFVSGNSTIDSRSNQITRYFTAGINYNLSKFGGGRLSNAMGDISYSY